MKTVKDLGERKVIETILELLDSMPNMPIPFGDDASAIQIDEEKLIVVKVDMLVAKTDVPQGMSMRQAARKAIVMNVSDFAAKGAKPIAALVSLGLPSDLTEEEVRQIGLGLNDGAREYEIYVIGGDTNESSDLIIDCALVGICKKMNLMMRSGARPGDIVAVTGYFGKTSSGLKILLNGLFPPEELRHPLVKSVLMPKARLREGLALAEIGAVTSSIDSSDGLAWSLHELSKASGVGFIIENIPVAPEVQAFAEKYALDPVDLSLYGGEEYELVVTIKPELWDKANEVLRRFKTPLIKIGKVIEEKKIKVRINGETKVVERRGWEHFKSSS
ncbi:MAG: thiamine-phosphate kinase [Candidatus Bathyarchaeia archaeon]|nr:thiamine-phosphate kinase [Candidatus Bathyarchaeota archaeon]